MAEDPQVTSTAAPYMLAPVPALCTRAPSLMFDSARITIQGQAKRFFTDPYGLIQLVRDCQR